MAHGSTLEATKAHNLEVEQRFVDNQLQKFRQQLARQFQRSKSHKVPPTKPDFKLNNKPLVQSLTQAALHIDNFYSTPVQALSQMTQMCSETKAAATKSLIKQLRPEPEKEADMDHEWAAEQQALVMELPAFHEEEVVSFDCLEYRNFAKQVQADESKAQLLRCRTPSPLTSTEEFFRPMRAAAERQMLHVRTVRHEEELQEEHKQGQQQQEGNPPPLQRESSTCSNTSDGIDSVISDLAEEALYELQLEAAEEQNEQLDKELPLPTKHVQFQLPQKKTPTPIGGESDPEPEPEPEALIIRRIELPKVVVKPKEPEPPEPESSDSDDGLEEAPTHEKQKIIDQLFQARANTEMVMMRKYFLKWIHFTTLEKIEREQGQVFQARDNRVHKINAFLDKVRQEKRRQRTVQATDAAAETSKITQKSLEKREEAVKMEKQFKNK